MKYLSNIFILIFSVGILLIPSQNLFAQNAAPQSCCTGTKACHDEMPSKDSKKPATQDCCNISLAVFDFLKQGENLAATVDSNFKFQQKNSFFHNNEMLPNSYLEAIFQPPRFS